MEDNNNSNLTEEDKKLLERMRPEKKREFQFFPSPDDYDERPWILKNLWWILIIVVAIIISIIR
jgi:hypothetical protein